MRWIFSFVFLRDRSFREKTDVIFIDIDTVSVWHRLTMIVDEYLSTYLREYLVA